LRKRQPLFLQVDVSDDPPLAVMRLNQGGAAFAPIAIIHIDDIIVRCNLCVMDVAAYDAIVSLALAVESHLLFKFADVVRGQFSSALEVFGQAPRLQPQHSTGDIDDLIDIDQAVVCEVTKMHDHTASFCSHQIVKHITVNDKVSFAVVAYMHATMFYRYSAYTYWRKAAEDLIMITRYIDNFCLFGYLQDFSENLVVFFWPVPFLLQTPNINDITD
jgi:hypothetical protein